MVVLTSTAEGKYQPSEGWKRVEEESRRAGVTKSGRFGAADLRLETILERTMRVFITTRAATFATDVEGALFQMARVLKARAAALYIATDDSGKRPELAVAVSPNDTDQLADVVRGGWSTQDASISPHCSFADDESPNEEALRHYLGGNRLSTIPLLNDYGVTGWLFLTFDDPTLRLSPRKLTQLGTFAQFCLLLSLRHAPDYSRRTIPRRDLTSMCSHC